MNINMYRIFFKIQQKHWWFVTKKEIVLDAIDSHVNRHEKVNILDIGCGSGLMLCALADVGQTFGMDMSDEAINFSKEIFKGQVEKGFLPDQVPYPENFFHLITALDVIEHVDEDVNALRAMRSRLTANGKAIITVPAYMFLWSAFDEMNEHKRRYTLTELKTKLMQAGFTIEKISYFNTILFPIVFLVRMFNNILGRDGASDVDMPSAPVNSLLRWIFGLEKYLLKILNLPFGVSILAVVKK
ncbi:class I SAM-dependent methyltransferase [Polaromonas sp. YR568]|uniref:class I SAM-dependent methyltransferase n=1 Tax=Polaromonas sp. YR568 TaxID=1855301 RepID=UPI003137D07C